MSEAIPGIPEIARDIFVRLAAEPLRDAAELRQQVIDYVAGFDPVKSKGAICDPILAISISRACIALIDAIGEQAAEPERRLVQGACLYFTTEQDAVPDQLPGGLDDDLQVVNAVARHLGRDDLVVEKREAPEE